MEVSGQFHAPTAYTLRKGTLVPSEYGWVSDHSRPGDAPAMNQTAVIQRIARL
jgi:hypothetical protein